MKFLCQPFPTMSRVHAKFQEFLTTLGFYFIFLNMTSGRKCQITDINIWILEQDYGMGVHFGRGCEIYFLYNLLIHIWGTLLSVVSKLSQKKLFHYSVLLANYAKKSFPLLSIVRLLWHVGKNWIANFGEYVVRSLKALWMFFSFFLCVHLSLFGSVIWPPSMPAFAVRSICDTTCMHRATH